MSSAVVVLCLGFLVCSVLGGEYCTVDVPSTVSTTTSYCEYGCCGTAADDNRTCCEDEKTSLSEGKYCTIDDESYPYTITTSYCEHGCCGNAAKENRRCCEDGSANIYYYAGGGAGGSAGFAILCLCCCSYSKK